MVMNCFMRKPRTELNWLSNWLDFKNPEFGDALNDKLV